MRLNRQAMPLTLLLSMVTSVPALGQIDLDRPAPFIMNEFDAIASPAMADCERYAHAALELRSRGQEGWSSLLRVTGEVALMIDPKGPGMAWLETVRAEGEDAYERALASNGLAWQFYMGEDDTAKARPLFDSVIEFCEGDDQARPNSRLHYSALNGLMLISHRAGNNDAA